MFWELLSFSTFWIAWKDFLSRFLAQSTKESTWKVESFQLATSFLLWWSNPSVNCLIITFLIPDWVLFSIVFKHLRARHRQCPSQIRFSLFFSCLVVVLIFLNWLIRGTKRRVSSRRRITLFFHKREPFYIG